MAEEKLISTSKFKMVISEDETQKKKFKTSITGMLCNATASFVAHFADSNVKYFLVFCRRIKHCEVEPMRMTIRHSI